MFLSVNFIRSLKELFVTPVGSICPPFLPIISAATPATWGDAMLVPAAKYTGQLAGPPAPVLKIMS